MNPPLELLKKAVAKHGSNRAAARALGVSHESVCGALAGRLPISRKVQRALGLTEIGSERRKRQAKCRVLEALHGFASPVMAGDVAEVVGMPDHTVKALLCCLRREGLVRHAGYRWAARPNARLSPTSPPQRKETP